jgi:ABC-type spermidine/putrescine transport system permease subunit I
VADAAVTESAGAGAPPSEPGPPAPTKKSSRRRRPQQTTLHGSSLWPLLAIPGTVWLILFFVAPMYVVLAIVFGRIDPVFRTPLPVWNPLQWNPAQFNYVFSHMVGAQGFFGPALLRTLLFVVVASLLSLLIAYPVAYFTARFAGKRKGIILTLLIAPFWISYMMRMLAWVNLLQNDGLVNRTLSFGGLFQVNVDWLSGRASTVILGLVYGYVPYMILPLFAGLDRIQTSLLEAARDLGAGRLSTFWRVTWRLSLPAVVASVLLSCLPMLGDYFTNDLLSASPSTSMVGNLINNSALAPGQTGQAGAFVLLVLVVSLIPMFWYVRTSRDDGARS